MSEGTQKRAADRLFAALTPLMMKPAIEAPLDADTRAGLAAIAKQVRMDDPSPAEAQLAAAVDLACEHHPYEQPSLGCVSSAYALVEWLRFGKARAERELADKPRHVQEALR